MNKLTKSETRISLDDLIEDIKSNQIQIKKQKKKDNRRILMKSSVVIQQHEIFSEKLTEIEIDDLKSLIRKYQYDKKNNQNRQYQFFPPSLVVNFD